MVLGLLLVMVSELESRCLILKIYLFSVYDSFSCMIVCQVYAVVTETRRRCGILWNGSHRWLLGPTWVLGTQPGFSAKAEHALHCWAISPASGTQYFKNLTDSDFLVTNELFCRYCHVLGQTMTLRGILSSPVCYCVNLWEELFISVLSLQLEKRPMRTKRKGDKRNQIENFVKKEAHVMGIRDEIKWPW